MKAAFIVTGLGFGDEGKGSLVDALCRKYQSTLVIRHNGGAQAAHNVVEGSTHHTFAQFGSGSLTGARTYLSQHMVVNPATFLNEAFALKRIAPVDRVYVHEDALVTTYYHQAMNRLRESLRGDGRHGSCGLGVGDTVHDSLAYPEVSIRVKDLRDPIKLREKLSELKRHKFRQVRDLISFGSDAWKAYYADVTREDWSKRMLEFASLVQIVDSQWLRTQASTDQVLIFEGAQGVLLDELYGFHPHTTWSNTTSGNARSILKEAEFGGPVTNIGLIRAFHTRHGAGPFVTEDPMALPLAAHDHNAWGEWQQGFRVGALDIPALQYAIDAEAEKAGVDCLAVTNLDRLSILEGGVPICTAYRSQELRANPEFFYPYGVMSDIVRIRPPRVTDTSRQQRLGEELKKLSPEIRHRRPAKSREEQLSFALNVAERVGLRLAAASFGVSSKDKEFFL